jgi:hypothetical protein
MHRPPDFLPRDGQVSTNALGEALKLYAQSRWPHDTAKQAARAWGIDTETGKNVAKGHASSRVLTAAVKADGYAVLDAMGEALTGVTRLEYERARINQMLGELEIANSDYELLFERAAALDYVAAQRRSETVSAPHERRQFSRRRRPVSA